MPQSLSVVHPSPLFDGELAMHLPDCDGGGGGLEEELLPAETSARQSNMEQNSRIGRDMLLVSRFCDEWLILPLALCTSINIAVSLIKQTTLVGVMTM